MEVIDSAACFAVAGQLIMLEFGFGTEEIEETICVIDKWLIRVCVMFVNMTMIWLSDWEEFGD